LNTDSFTLLVHNVGDLFMDCFASSVTIAKTLKHFLCVSVTVCVFQTQTDRHRETNSRTHNKN